MTSANTTIHRQRGFDLVLVLCATAILALFGLLGWVIYDDVVSEKIVLRKDQWECTEHGVVTVMVPMPIGKTTQLLPTTTTECLVYRRRP